MEPDSPQRRAPRAWIALLVIVLIFVGAKLAGADAWVETARLQEWVGAAGPWGPALFVAIFVAAVVLQVPGMIFVLAAPVLFPLPVAVLVVLVGANLGCNVGFLVVRRLGGQTIKGTGGPALMQRAFRQLADHPVRSVFIIRLIVFIFPPVTGALAMTKLRLRDHAIGSGLAVSPIFAGIVYVEALALT